MRCPYCGEQYSFDRIKLVDYHNGIFFLELDCGKHSPLIASVAIDQKGVDTAEVSQPISTDELISAYKNISSANKLKDIIG